MPDDDSVNITRNKRLLESLRKQEEGKVDVSKQSGAGVSDGYVEGRTRVDRQDSTSGSRPHDGNAEGTRAAAKANGTSSRLREGVRPPDRQSVDANKSSHSSNRGNQERVTFQLRNPFKVNADVQLFSETEAEAEYERMFEIYFRGSGLLDDILEIIVKGHEEVQIWQLDDEDASMLARMHLQRARHDEGAARSARQLLALYDRLYFWLLVGPRAKMTYTHVREHGGLSFR